MLFPGLRCALDRDGSSHINLTVNRNNAVIGGTFVEYDMSKNMSGENQTEMVWLSGRKMPVRLWINSSKHRLRLIAVNYYMYNSQINTKSMEKSITKNCNSEQLQITSIF